MSNPWPRSITKRDPAYMTRTSRSSRAKGTASVSLLRPSFHSASSLSSMLPFPSSFPRKSSSAGLDVHHQPCRSAARLYFALVVFPCPKQRHIMHAMAAWKQHKIMTTHSPPHKTTAPPSHRHSFWGPEAGCCLSPTSSNVSRFLPSSRCCRYSSHGFPCLS